MSSPDLYRRPMPEGAELHVLEELSFSHEAARDIRRQCKDIELRFHERIEDVLAAVRGETSYGLLPLDNSSSGPVEKHIDALLERPDLSIVFDIPWQVQMCVGGLRDATLADARTVCSHPKAIEQCSEFLAQHPHIKQQKHTTTTSKAAREVQGGNDPRRVVLASKLAVEALHLKKLAQDVSNLKGYLNQTSMVGLHANGARHLPDADARYHAIDLTLSNKSGVLWNVLQVIARARVDLTSLHSRKAPDGQYRFFLEMDRAGEPDRFGLMADALQAEPDIARQRWLGSWDVRYNADERGRAPNQVVRPRGQMKVPDSLDAPEHRLLITPRNKLGILGRILGMLADGGANLTDLHSRTIGPKEYAFDMSMRREGTVARFERMVRVLRSDEDILSMEWSKPESDA